MNLRTLSFIFIFFSFFLSQAQKGFFIKKGEERSDKVRFDLINNLIIIPVEVNGVELYFLLDTGVSKPIIFNYNEVSDVLKLNHTKRIYLQGLGNGDPVEAIKSEFNTVKIGNIQCGDQDLYVINDNDISFAPRLGIPVHGVIGYDVFKNFIVEVNYSAEYIRFYNPDSFKYKKCKKCETLPISIHNSKPYINSFVQMESEEVPVKLLVDTGGSDALWLFEDDSLGIHLGSKKYFDDFLGHGLSGSVYGRRSKIAKFRMNSFELERPNVAFPDSVSIVATRIVKDRNGSISGNILKRFNIWFDYPNETMTFKKNHLFKEKFSYNKSGIELEHNGVRLLQEEVFESDGFNVNDLTPEARSHNRISLVKKMKFSFKPAYTVVELRKGSPAERAGIQLGDVIVSINRKETHKMKLQDVMAMFYGEKGKTMRVKVDRSGEIMIFVFELESLLD